VTIGAALLPALIVAGCAGARPWHPQPSAACLRHLPPLQGSLVRVPKLTERFRNATFGTGLVNKSALLTVSTIQSHHDLWLAEFFTPSGSRAKTVRNRLSQQPPGGFPLGVRRPFYRLSTSRNVVLAWRLPVTTSVERAVVACLHS
jgi:hypothetical protein